MSGIGVITNPRSKANKRDPGKMVRLAYLLGSRGEAQATRSLDDLYRVAEAFKAADIDILGINGGDGTIHVTLTAFLKVYGEAPFPKVALLGGGTLNTIAKGLGVHGDTQDTLYSIIDRYHAGDDIETISRPIMKIGEQFGFIFGNGLVANFLDAYYATGKPSPATGAKLVARAVFAALFRTRFYHQMSRRWHGRVTVDGERWAREDYTTLTCATVPEIGLGFRPWYRVLEQPDKLQLLGIHCGAGRVVAQLLRLRRGRPMRRNGTIDALCRDVTIESDEPWRYTVDGDIHSADKGALSISTGPTLNVIVSRPVVE
jgi:diacylglycerol kinase family enzyme